MLDFAESAGFEEAVGDAQVRKASSSHRNFCSIHRGFRCILHSPQGILGLIRHCRDRVSFEELGLNAPAPAVNPIPISPQT